MTRAAPTVWPHCDVPPPRGSTGTPASTAICSATTAASAVRGTTTPDGLDLVDGGVGGVAAAARAVEEHVAVDFPPQALGEGMAGSGGLGGKGAWGA